MKNKNLLFNLIFAVALVLLYVLYFTGDHSTVSSGGKEEQTGEKAEALRIAYVKIDSVVLNYELTRDLHADFTLKQDAYNKEFGAKANDFQRDAAAFQEKVQRGGFISQDLAMKERNRLVGVEEEVKRMDYELSNKLADLQQKHNQQVLDSVSNFLKEYNEKNDYTFILGNTDVLVGKEKHNITAEILSELNRRYQKSKSKN